MASNDEIIIQDIQILIKAILSILAKEGDIKSLEYPKYVDKRLYDLYNFDIQYREDIWEIIALKANSSLHIKYESAIKKISESIEAAKALCIQQDGKILRISNGKPDFYCESLPEFKTHDFDERVYFNPNPEYLHLAVEFLIKLMLAQSIQSKSVECHFKFWSIPDVSTLVRSDKVVLYCFNKGFRNEVISNLNKIKHMMNKDAPRFTYRLADGIGYASSPTQKHENWFGGRASFGSFICLVIARYLAEWYKRNKAEVNRRGALYGPELARRVAAGQSTKDISIISESNIRMLAEKIYYDELKKRHAYEFEPK